MTSIFTEDVSGDYKKLSDDDIKNRITEIVEGIREVERKEDEKIIKEQLQKFVEDGLMVQDKETGKYYPKNFVKPFTGR